MITISVDEYRRLSEAAFALDRVKATVALRGIVPDATIVETVAREVRQDHAVSTSEGVEPLTEVYRR